MIRTTSSMEKATFVSTFLSKLTFSCQNDYCPCSPELESKRTKSSWQYGNMVRTTVSIVRSTLAKLFSLWINIFLVKMTIVPEVWSWSLRGQRSSWQHGNMIRTTVLIVGASWHFLSQDDACPLSLELESRRTKIVLTAWRHDQDNCLNGRSNFC